MSGILVLIDGFHGVHIPQMFAESIIEGWDNIDDIDLKILREGPGADGYWETWDHILNAAMMTDKNGNEWYLHQDGDLFLMCDALITPEQAEDFWGN